MSYASILSLDPLEPGQLIRAKRPRWGMQVPLTYHNSYIYIDPYRVVRASDLEPEPQIKEIKEEVRTLPNIIREIPT